MALPGKTKGYFEEQGPDGIRRGETFTCCHCNTIHEVDRTKRSLICEHCFAPVCESVDCRQCVPFEKKLIQYEKAMARAGARNSIFAAAGIK